MYMNLNLKRVILFIVSFCMLIILVGCRSEKHTPIHTTKETITEEPTDTVRIDDTSEDAKSLEVTEITEDDNAEETTGIVETTEVQQEEIEEVEEESQKTINLGRFVLTAYCSCSKCCGIYALNRPVDEYGNEIVYGASGERLVAGTSIAVDPRVIPYGSEVVINGHTYIAHDTGGGIKGYHIDVYFDSHQEACNFGLQYAEVFLVAN